MVSADKNFEIMRKFLLHFVEQYDIITKLSLRHAPLAQLDRASGYGPEGRGFESLTAYHLEEKPATVVVAGFSCICNGLLVFPIGNI